MKLDDLPGNQAEVREGLFDIREKYPREWDYAVEVMEFGRLLEYEHRHRVHNDALRIMLVEQAVKLSMSHRHCSSSGRVALTLVRE